MFEQPILEKIYEQPAEDRQSTGIITRHLKTTLRAGRSEALYEQVIERNFQIIGDLLRKLDCVFLKHEEFEIERVNYAKRLVKIQADIEAIHNQYRRDNLQISSRMDDLKLELNGIDKQIRIIYQDYGRKGFGHPFNSYKIIDNLELHSQKCVSNCEDLLNRGLLKESKHVNLCVKPHELRRKEKTISRQGIDRKSEYSQHFLKDPTNQTSHGKISQIPSMKGPQHSQVKFKRKITSSKKNQLRKSLDDKMQKNCNIRSLHNHNTMLIQNEHESGEQKYQDQQKKDTHKYLYSQVSFHTSCYEDIDDRKGKDEPKAKFNQSKRNELNETKVIFNCISNLISKAHESSCDGKDEKKGALEHLIRLSLQEEKIKEVNKRIDENSQKCKQLYGSILDITTKCQTFVLRQRFSQEIFNLKKEVQQLRENVFQNFANKKQTKQALLFLEGKIRSKAIEFNPAESQFSSGMMSKCLGCNRAVSCMEDSSLKANSYLNTMNTMNTTIEAGKEKKVNMKDLKKRTMEVLKNEKVRAFSKCQRVY